jgi:hypothetical protein
MGITGGFIYSDLLTKNQMPVTALPNTTQRAENSNQADILCT